MTPKTPADSQGGGYGRAPPSLRHHPANPSSPIYWTGLTEKIGHNLQ